MYTFYYSSLNQTAAAETRAPSPKHRNGHTTRLPSQGRLCAGFQFEHVCLFVSEKTIFRRREKGEKEIKRTNLHGTIKEKSTLHLAKKKDVEFPCVFFLCLV
jgi:hypothetical protein